MKGALCLILMIMLFSCQKNDNGNKLKEAESLLSGQWLLANSLENFSLQNGLIDRPLGSWQLLLRIGLSDYQDEEVNWFSHCVYYRVPYKRISGQLQITKQTRSENCPEAPSGQSLFDFENVSQLHMNFEVNKLQLEFSIKNIKYSWNFLFPNLTSGVAHQKYLPPSPKKLFPLLTILPDLDRSPIGESDYYVGKLQDRFSLNTAKLCRKMNKKCQIEGEDICERCRYGWYEVVDYQCPQGGSRFCGQNHCGEKNEPACIRGQKVVEQDDRGICESDLSPVRNSEQILLCQ